MQMKKQLQEQEMEQKKELSRLPVTRAEHPRSTKQMIFTNSSAIIAQMLKNTCIYFYMSVFVLRS